MQSVYKDILRLFRGEYPGFGSIKTLYHDLSHTLEVFMCGVRLMHGAHLSGDQLKDEEITLIVLAILMHDVGYAQHRGEETGTGAQFTQTHVQRGIEFMRQYFAERKLPSAMAASLTCMILGTEHNRPFTRIDFHDDRALLLGRIVATADNTGQMADRIYLEKLLFLYLEFKEARFGIIFPTWVGMNAAPMGGCTSASGYNFPHVGGDEPNVWSAARSWHFPHVGGDEPTK